MQKNSIIKELRIELARRSFWQYCKALYPEFYTEDKEYLKGLCDTLQSAPPRMMINMPPRSYKSLTLMLYETWLFGQDPDTRVLTVSYNDIVAGRFAQGVRNTIQATTVEDDIIFSDIFPGVRIKRGDASMSLWALEGRYFSYKGSGISASLTGLGCTLGVIDDPIKNAAEAFNAEVLDKHYQFYKDTFLSRIETGGRIIINHTRWVENDLCGIILQNEPDQWKVYSVSMENEDGSSLCRDIMSDEELKVKKAAMSPEIWAANYKQEIIRSGNCLYTDGFSLVPDIPGDLPVMVILDPADKGGDFFAGAAFVQNGTFYDIKDTFRDPGEMIDIEDKLVKWLEKCGAKVVFCETNHAGNYFMKKLKEKCPGVAFKGFASTTNKEARIRAASWWLQQNVRFHRSLVHTPFYTEIIGFKAKFTANRHDDCADTLTSIYEKFGVKKTGTAARI